MEAQEPACRRGEIVDWLATFADCVRRRDIAAAEALFVDDVVAFGTRNGALQGLPRLRDQQWFPTWHATRDFGFVPDSLVVDVAASGDCAWGAGRWISWADSADGSCFERSGRATFAFVWRAGWRCAHSHLSLTPSGAL